MPSAIVVTAFLLVGVAEAATFKVGDDPREYEDLKDEDLGRGGCDVGRGFCTLRAAVEESNATRESDQILLYGGGVFQLTKGQLTIASSVTVTGVGDAPIIDAQGDSRVIAICHPSFVAPAKCRGTREFHDVDPWVRIHNVMITGGAGVDRYPTGYEDNNFEAGGGIFVGYRTTLWLTDAEVIDNTASKFGGGIFNAGTLRVERSTIANNSTTGRPEAWWDGCGGGVCLLGGLVEASAEFERTLIAGNSAWIGGGIGSLGGLVHLRNSTISDNHAAQAGGGLLLLAGGTAGISFTTITGNATTCHVSPGRRFCDRSGFRDFGGGGLYIQGSIVLGNSVVADNIDLSNPLSRDRAPDCEVGSVLHTAGNNVIGDDNHCPRRDAAVVGSHASDKILYGADPGLNPLADNGGPTATHALASNSPAIDAIRFDSSAAGDFFRPLDVDQRGLSRPGSLTLTDWLDAGAYEAGALQQQLVNPRLKIVPDEVIGGEARDLVLFVPISRPIDRPLRVRAGDEDVRVTGLLQATYGSAIVRVEVDDQAPIGPRSLVVEDGEHSFDVPIAVVIDRDRAESVAVDIMPGACPNVLPSKSEDALRAAFLGSKDLDPSQIDSRSVRLEGVAPVSHHLVDIGAPVLGDKASCPEGADKIEDLELEFDQAEVLRAAGPVVPGFELSLELTAALKDGTPIRGHDAVRLAE